MTQCLETLYFTIWLTKVQLNSVLVALSIKQQEHGSRHLHPQTILSGRNTVLDPSIPKRDSSVSQYVTCTNLSLYLSQKSTVGCRYPPIQRDQRENNTPARRGRVAMETREKSGNDVMEENLFLVKSGVSFQAGHQTQRLVVWCVRNNIFFFNL